LKAWYAGGSERPRAALVGAFGAVYLLWGSCFLAVRFAIETVPPFTMSATRLLLAGAILYSWGRLRDRERPRAAHWRAGILTGGLLFVLLHGGLAWAQQNMASGVASLFVASIPLWMTLLQAFQSGAGTINARTVIGVAGGFLGLFLLVGPRSVAGGTPVDLMGASVILLGALSWAVGSSRSRTAPRPVSHTTTTGIYLLTGGGLLLLLALLTGEVRQLNPEAISARSVLALGYLTLFGSIVSFHAYTWLLQHATLSAVGTYAYVNPLVAVLLGWLLAGERLTARILIATAFIVGAVALTLNGQVTRQRQERASAVTLGCKTGRRITSVEER
jgi:drug/metabolite transporter (DMT)-like permease